VKTGMVEDWNDGRLEGWKMREIGNWKFEIGCSTNPIYSD
jgi:hypothetical protein